MSWLWTNVINPIWPNLAASLLWATPAFVLHQRAVKRHVSAELERHRELTGGAP
jgi:hypothetical protein